ncbi:hypothetical protein C4588_04245 [Candidatus Parcubacteria bacterium]|jgi:site-specific recombinase XerD|nr:MAG: hypothetical protein C4588_04245 [Candidatus Parcubacteria bacterium]
MSTRLIRLSQAIEGFLLECKARQLSRHTIDDYSRTLRSFLQTTGDLPAKEIQSHHIVFYLAQYTELQPKSLLNKHIALSALWTWLMRENYVQRHIVRQVPRPKPQKKAIIPFTETEIRALFSVVGRKYYRNRAILLLLLDTGIRASELIQLTYDDIDLRARRIRVMGKGNKERYIPVSPRTASALFRIVIRKDDSNHQRLFDITRLSLTHLLVYIGKKSGVKGVYPHRFRHTFAVYYLRNGGDPYTLQQILGHSTMQMVSHYLQLAQVDIDDAHRRASPVDRFRL